jgi:hypothetical protein
MAVSRLSQQSIQQSFPKGNTLWDGTTATSSFDSLGSVYLSSTTATVVFSSIPQTYAHLHIRGVSRSSDGGASDVTLQGQFNGDTGSNYSFHRIYGYGSTVNVDNSANSSAVALGSVLTDGNTGSNYTSHVIDILDYTSSVKHKSTRGLSGFNNNGNGSIHFSSGAWRAASIGGITSILLKPSTGSFMTGTTFSLYGIK